MGIQRSGECKKCRRYCHSLKKGEMCPGCWANSGPALLKKLRDRLPQREHHPNCSIHSQKECDCYGKERCIIQDLVDEIESLFH